MAMNHNIDIHNVDNLDELTLEYEIVLKRN